MYGREVDGRALTLRATGWTYENTFVLMDDETGSLWHPYWRGLQAIQGPLRGKRLKKVATEDTTWGRWKELHPETLVIR